MRPCRWFRTSFRYQFRGDRYATQVEAEPIVKTSMLSTIYTYDVTLEPIRSVTATASFSRQTSMISTPARLVSGGKANTPKFNSNVSTWMVDVDYAPKTCLVLTGALLYSQARNFNDDSILLGLPLGADFQRVDLTTGVKWTIREEASLGMQYAFFHYLPNADVQSGAYNAHVIWLDVSKKF